MLTNIGFDYLTVYNSSTRSPVTLIKQWPIDIADSLTVPGTLEASGRAGDTAVEMLVEFQTGGYSGASATYQGFKARYEDATPRFDRGVPQ